MASPAVLTRRRDLSDRPRFDETHQSFDRQFRQFRIISLGELSLTEEARLIVYTSERKKTFRTRGHMCQCVCVGGRSTLIPGNTTVRDFTKKKDRNTHKILKNNKRLLRTRQNRGKFSVKYFALQPALCRV